MRIVYEQGFPDIADNGPMLSYLLFMSLGHFATDS